MLNIIQQVHQSSWQTINDLRLLYAVRNKDTLYHRKSEGILNRSQVEKNHPCRDPILLLPWLINGTTETGTTAGWFFHGPSLKSSLVIFEFCCFFFIIQNIIEARKKKDFTRLDDRLIYFKLSLGWFWMVFQGMVTLPHYSAAAATLRFALTHMNQIFTDTKSRVKIFL